MTVAVTLSADPERTVTVPLTVTAGGMAIADDYTLSEMSVTINAGQMSATFTVLAVEDMVDDDDESITIGFGTLPSRGDRDQPRDHHGEPGRQRRPGRHGAVRRGVVHGDGGRHGGDRGGDVVGGSRAHRDVPLSVTAGGGATTGDYTLSEMSVTFNAGEMSATLTVTAEDDSEDDDGESIMIGFGTLPAGVSAGSTASTTVSLVDDDGPAVTAVTVRFGAATYTATEDGMAATVDMVDDRSRCRRIPSAP